jgi:class 3 adenylate cyclase/YHS domain-containing protein
VNAGADTESSTFVFADLAGFTALTEAHGDRDAVEIATSFATHVRGLLPEHRAEEIKTIGDEVMIRVADPVEAVRLGLRITRELAAPGKPPVRVGMHFGPALSHDGDWYGATVNLASRVSGAAHPGEVLVTGRLRREVPESPDFELVEHGSRYFKNIPERVDLHRAIGAGEAPLQLEVDPVCRMAVDPRAAAATRHRIGVTHHFCSTACAEAFSANPRRYVAPGAAGRAARRGFLLNLGAFLAVGAAHLIGWIAGSSEPEHLSPMIFLFAAWAVVIALHFRVVRAVL